MAVVVWYPPHSLTAAQEAHEHHTDDLRLDSCTLSESLHPSLKDVVGVASRQLLIRWILITDHDPETQSTLEEGRRQRVQD